MTSKKPLGRPPGIPGAKTRTVTHQIGPWTWNSKSLHERIVKGSPDECWAWTGSRNQHSNIFGAYKNGSAQMTQSNRLLYMEETGFYPDGMSVYMKCGNRHCSNPNHFDLQPSKGRPGRKPKQ